jgi:hypothetical protein
MGRLDERLDHPRTEWLKRFAEEVSSLRPTCSIQKMMSSLNRKSAEESCVQNPITQLLGLRLTATSKNERCFDGAAVRWLGVGHYSPTLCPRTHLCVPSAVTVDAAKELTVAKGEVFKAKYLENASRHFETIKTARPGSNKFSLIGYEGIA